MGHNLWEKLKSYYEIRGVDCLIKSSSEDNYHYLIEKSVINKDNFIRDTANNWALMTEMKWAEYIVWAGCVDIYLSEQKPESSFQHLTDLMGFLLKLKQFNESPKRFIFLSSTSVYGNWGSRTTGFTEGDYLNPMGVYARNKQCSEILLRDFAEKFQIPITVLRLTNIYSGNQANSYENNGIVFKILDSYFQNKPLAICTNNFTRDFVHIDDLVRIIKILLIPRKPRSIYEIYNIGTDEQYRILDIAKRIGQILHKKKDITFYENKADKIISRQVNSDKFNSEFKFRPEIKIFDEGLKLAIEEYKNRYNSQ